MVKKPFPSLFCHFFAIKTIFFAYFHFLLYFYRKSSILDSTFYKAIWGFWEGLNMFVKKISRPCWRVTIWQKLSDGPLRNVFAHPEMKYHHLRSYGGPWNRSQKLWWNSVFQAFPRISLGNAFISHFQASERVWTWLSKKIFKTMLARYHMEKTIGGPAKKCFCALRFEILWHGDARGSLG